METNLKNEGYQRNLNLQKEMARINKKEGRKEGKN